MRQQIAVPALELEALVQMKTLIPRSNWAF